MARPEWRIFRSPRADYCNELADVVGSYDRATLERIRSDGFNAIWLRVVLREMVKTFPGLTPRAGAVEALGDIVARCEEAGLGAFVYLNEPLGFPGDHAFWDDFPHLRGQRDQSFDDGWDDANALCSSQPETREFLESATRRLFQQVSGLAGVIMITASEHLTHCYSHESKYRRTAKANEPLYPLSCPRCAERKPASIIGEIVDSVSRGVRSVKPEAEIICWNWSWSYYEDAPQREILAALPRGVTVMVDFERGGEQRLETGDKLIPVDEYSLGYTGPSLFFQSVAREAQRVGFPVMAKLQIGTTHEIATVPNIPLIPNLVHKLIALREMGGEGYVASWCFGTFASLNTFAAGWVSRHPEADEVEALSGIAEEYFPGAGAATVVTAWRYFAEAFAHFPQIQDWHYVGPVNFAPAYPWRSEGDLPMEPTWFPPKEPGTRFAECLGPLSMDEMIVTLGKLLQLWDEGVRIYENALAGCAEDRARLEVGVAIAIGLQLASARNLLIYHASGADDGGLASLCDSEIENLQQLLRLLEGDDRIGYHQGSFPKPVRFYDSQSIMAKIGDLRAMRLKLQAR